jgi:hypothetical protein
MSRILLRVVQTVWAAPWSLFGLGVGTLGLISGGRIRRVGRILEIWGGCLPKVLNVFPFFTGSPVATFGHVVLGRTACHLDACREHQLIHVAQYERWGVLFVPAYLVCSLVLRCSGRHPYYENPFEQEAYRGSRGRSYSETRERRDEFAELPGAAGSCVFATYPVGQTNQGR